MEKHQFLGVYRLVPRLHIRSAWTPEDDEAVQRHFAMLQEAAKRGQVILAGRTDEELDRTFGIVVFEAPDPGQAKAFMESDPAVRGGVMSWELHPYRIAVLRR